MGFGDWVGGWGAGRGGGVGIANETPLLTLPVERAAEWNW